MHILVLHSGRNLSCPQAVKILCIPVIVLYLCHPQNAGHIARPNRPTLTRYLHLSLSCVSDLVSSQFSGFQSPWKIYECLEKTLSCLLYIIRNNPAISNDMYLMWPDFTGTEPHYLWYNTVLPWMAQLQAISPYESWGYRKIYTIHTYCIYLK